jgi:Protein of unknown function (DUF4031)
MTVYVDDAAIEAQVGRYRSRWSHLTADSREELHAFAARLGLRRSWFQPGNTSGLGRPGSFSAEAWHYDVTAGKRMQAIRLGAQAVTSAELNEIIWARTSPASQARRAARDTAPGASPVPGDAGPGQPGVG